MCNFWKKNKAKVHKLAHYNHARAESKIEWRTINGQRFWTTRNHDVASDAKEASRPNIPSPTVNSAVQIVEFDNLEFKLPNQPSTQLTN